MPMNPDTFKCKMENLTNEGAIDMMKLMETWLQGKALTQKLESLSNEDLIKERDSLLVHAKAIQSLMDNYVPKDVQEEFTSSDPTVVMLFKEIGIF